MANAYKISLSNNSITSNAMVFEQTYSYTNTAFVWAILRNKDVLHFSCDYCQYPKITDLLNNVNKFSFSVHKNKAISDIFLCEKSDQSRLTSF